MTGGWSDRWDAPAEPSWVIEPTSEWHPQFRGQRYPGDIGNRYADPRGRALGRAGVPPLAPTRPDGTYLGRSWADQQDDETTRRDDPHDGRRTDHDAYRRPVDEPIWQRERRRPVADRPDDRAEPDRYDGRPEADQRAGRTSWSDRRRGDAEPVPTGWHRDRAAPDRHRTDRSDTPPRRDHTAPGVTPVSPGRSPVSPAPRHEPPRDHRPDRFAEPGWMPEPDETTPRRRTTGERPAGMARPDRRSAEDGYDRPAADYDRKGTEDGYDRRGIGDGYDRRGFEDGYDRHPAGDSAAPGSRAADESRHYAASGYDPYPGRPGRPERDLPTRFREDEPPRSTRRAADGRPAAHGHDDQRRRPVDDGRGVVSPIPEERWQHPRGQDEHRPPAPREAAARAETYPDLRSREPAPPVTPPREPWSRADAGRAGTVRPPQETDHGRDGRQPYPRPERRPAEPQRPVTPPARYDDRPAAQVSPERTPDHLRDRRAGTARAPGHPVPGTPSFGPPPGRPVSGTPVSGPPVSPAPVPPAQTSPAPSAPAPVPPAQVSPAPSAPAAARPAVVPPRTPVPPADPPTRDRGTEGRPSPADPDDVTPISAPPATRLHIEFRQPPQDDRRAAAPPPLDRPAFTPPSSRSTGLEITPDKPRRYVPPAPEPDSTGHPDTAPQATPNSSAAWFRPRPAPVPPTGTTDGSDLPGTTATTASGTDTGTTDTGATADTGARSVDPPVRSGSSADSPDTAPRPGAVPDAGTAPARESAPAQEPVPVDTVGSDPLPSGKNAGNGTPPPGDSAGPTAALGRTVSAPPATGTVGTDAGRSTDAGTEPTDTRTGPADTRTTATGTLVGATDPGPAGTLADAVGAGASTTTDRTGTTDQTGTADRTGTATEPTADGTDLGNTGSAPTAATVGEPDGSVPTAAAVPLDDPEQLLAGYRWRLDPQTLREVADDPAELRILRRRLTEKLASALDNRARARLLSLRAVISRLVDDLDDALADGRLALTYAEATGELRRTALARARLAEALRWKGEFAEADRLFTEANSTELPDRLRSALHEHAGRSCYDQGRLIEACGHFERALDLRRAEDPELTGRIGVALDAVHARAVARGGFGPYPRSGDEVRHGRRSPRPTHDGQDRWGYADAEGDLVVDYRYAEAQPFHEQLAWVRRPDQDGWELIDESGAILLDPGYARVLPFSDGLAWVSQGGDADWSAIEPDGTVLVPAGFEEVRPFRAGVAAVRQGGWGATDRRGRLVVPPRYHGIRTTLSDGNQLDGFTDEGLAVVELAGRRGVVDRTGTVLVRPVHPALVIHPVAFLVGDGMSHWGALDRRGEPLIPPVHPDRDTVVAEIDRLLADTHPVL